MAIEQWGLFSVPHLLWHGIPFSLNPFTVSLYLPLEKDVVYHLERLKYTLYPRMICSSAQCFFPNSVYVLVFSLFRKYLPLENARPFNLFEQIWIVITQDCCVPSGIGSLVLKRMKMWKFYTNNDDDIDR